MDKGNIYKIVSDSTDKIYIGSTVKSLEERLEEHENNYEFWFNKEFKSGYVSSFEILKYGDYKIILIEEYPCSSYKELLKREGYYQLSSYSLCVNILIAGKKQHTFKKFKLDTNYICSCGMKMKNTYKTRRYHAKSELHKLKIRESHLEMIKTNPKFEVIDV
jgi:hypothetical protein